jgi:hypothetical protein
MLYHFYLPTKKQMKKISFIFLITITALISSCEKDLKINAPYKEIAVVYGLLNPNDAVQYIRINKAFLGEGNALEMAKVPDSTNYKIGELDVKLLYVNTASVDTIQLSDTLTTLANAGGFSNQQVLYKTNTPILQGKTYKLRIKNKRTNNIVTSQTSTLNTFTPTGVANFYQAPAGYLNRPSSWSYNPVDVNAQVQITVKLHYTEVTANGSTEKTVDYLLPQVQANNDSGSAVDKGSVTLDGEQFYKYIGVTVPNDPAVINRKIGVVTFLITVINADLNNYILINQPSTGILQDKNQYTDIQNGIGFFSCRYTNSVDKTMTPASSEQLKTGPYTKTLKFID